MKRKIAIISCIFLLTITGCGSSSSNIKAIDNIESVDVAGDESAFMYTANISNSVDWNDMTFSEQGEFAQDVVEMIQDDSAYDTGTLSYSVQGLLNDNEVAFFYNSTDTKKIKLWVNGKYEDDYNIIN